MNESFVVQMKRKACYKCVNLSVKGQGEDFARREGWSSAISDRRAKRSVKRSKSKYGFSGRGEGVSG